MQMKTNGKMPPGKVGPPLAKTSLTGGHGSVGLATSTPTTSRAMVPILRKLDR